MRQRSLLIVAVVFLALAVLSGAVYAYDSGHRERIAAGVTIGGIDVGGLTRAMAEQRIEQALVEPVRLPIVVRGPDREWRLEPQDAGITADVSGLVDEALGISRRGWLLGRVVRDLTGRHLSRDVPAQLSYSDAAVVRLLDRVRRDVDRPAIDATLHYWRSAITGIPSRSGVAVEASALHRAIRAAIVTPGAVRTFIAPIHRVAPKITSAGLPDAYPVVLVIDRAAFRLRLFNRLKLSQTYPIAVGQIGLETPAGLYHIQWKEVNPVWHVPKRKWAKELAGKDIPPDDPRNPLKARWLAIYDGAGIHGTDDDSSIGSAASHGCIRMHISDVIALYPQVPVGAPVYIF